MTDAQSAQVSIVVLMLSISAAVWWLWVRRWKRFGELWPREPDAERTWNPGIVVLALSLIGFFLLAGLLPKSSPEPKPITVEQVREACLERGVLALIFIGLLTGFRSPTARAFGFTLAKWRQQVVVGLETAHASFLPVLALMTATIPFRDASDKNLLLILLNQDKRFSTLAWVVLAAVILAPLLEELLFRVILLGWLKSKLASNHAVGISSLVFAFIHGPLDGAALLPLALLLGTLYDRQQRFLSVFVAHAMFNLWMITLNIAGR